MRKLNSQRIALPRGCSQRLRTEPGTIPTELPVPPTAPQARANGSSSYPRVWQYVGAAAAAILLVLLVLGHFGWPAQPDDSRYTPDSITKAPKVLAVTETEERAGRARVLRERELVPTVAATATTFGKNPCFSSYVAELIPGIGSEERLGVIASPGLGAHATEEAQV